MVQRKIYSNRLRNLDNKKHLLKSLNNILNYFGKGEKLSNLSLDIIRRINDEGVNDNRISKLLSDISLDYPESVELIDTDKEEPYYKTYIELIKKFNPDIWPKFLTMLYNTKDEIENIINEKGV